MEPLVMGCAVPDSTTRPRISPVFGAPCALAVGETAAQNERLPMSSEWLMRMTGDWELVRGAERRDGRQRDHLNKESGTFMCIPRWRTGREVVRHGVQREN